MSPDKALEIRYTLAMQLSKDKTVTELDEIYNWVIRPQSKIVTPDLLKVK